MGNEGYNTNISRTCIFNNNPQYTTSCTGTCPERQVFKDGKCEEIDRDMCGKTTVYTCNNGAVKNKKKIPHGNKWICWTEIKQKGCETCEIGYYYNSAIDACECNHNADRGFDYCFDINF